MSNVPANLKRSLAALALLTGAGGGYFVYDDSVKKEAASNEYLQAVASDKDVSEAIKIAMVMAHFYESSNRHIGTPYIDKLGKGQPWTVCNGITGKNVIPGKYYTAKECFSLEKRFYLRYELSAKSSLTYWSQYKPYQQASFLDFYHNKGEGNFQTSTMRKLANAGDLIGACKQNTRWNRGTVNGLSTVLPGLDIRAKANAELCENWDSLVG